MSLFGTSPWNRWTNPGVQNLPDLPQGLQGVPSTTLPQAQAQEQTAASPATPTNIFRDIPAFGYNPWTGSQLADPWAFGSSESGLANIGAATSWQTFLNQFQQGLAGGTGASTSSGTGVSSLAQGASPVASTNPSFNEGPSVSGGWQANPSMLPPHDAYPREDPGVGFAWSWDVPSQSWRRVNNPTDSRLNPDTAPNVSGAPAPTPSPTEWGPVALPPPPSSPSSAPWTDWRGSPMPTRPPNPGMKWQLVVLPGAERQGATWQNVPLSTPDPVYGLL